MLRERLKRFLQLLFVGMPPVSNIKIHTVNSNNCMSQLNNYEFNWKKKKKLNEYDSNKLKEQLQTLITQCEREHHVNIKSILVSVKSYISNEV